MILGYPESRGSGDCPRGEQTFPLVCCRVGKLSFNDTVSPFEHPNGFPQPDFPCRVREASYGFLEYANGSAGEVAKDIRQS